MKRPDIAIKTLKACNIHSYHTQFMVEVSDWIDYLESRIQPVAVNETSTGDNAATQPRKTAKAECNGVTDDTEAVQAMLDKSQPRKTVSDAVDLFRKWKHDGFDYLFWHENLGFIHRESKDVPNCYVYVCTRKEFEAEVERRKGDEWTHVGRYSGGAPFKCKVVCKKEDKNENIVIYDVESCSYEVVHADSVEKRKPSISKAEAWSKLMAEHENPEGKSMFSAFYDILEQFEVK